MEHLCTSETDINVVLTLGSMRNKEKLQSFDTIIMMHTSGIGLENATLGWGINNFFNKTC